MTEIYLNLHIHAEIRGVNDPLFSTPLLFRYPVLLIFILSVNHIEVLTVQDRADVIQSVHPYT